MKKKYVVLSVLLAIVCWLSCKKDPYVPQSSYNVLFTVPKGWPQPYYTFTNNPLTYDGFQLGRRLFYDTRLSSDGTVACATCHQTPSAFANLDHRTSHGVYSLFGTRNAPGVFNMAWNTSYFWDGGVTNLENQPINPMTNPVEMNETLPDIIYKIKGDALYPGMFKRAFTDGQVTSQHIFQSLAQFMAMIISNNSRYDLYVNGNTSALNASEVHGLSLFRANCTSCHTEPLFSDFKFHNIGLPLIPTSAGTFDSGRAHITQKPDDLYKFKTPSLRNVALTPPYMHDGRVGMDSLINVLDFFDHGVTNNGPTLDTLVAKGIHFSQSDKQDIVNFLTALTDTTMRVNPLLIAPTNYPYSK